MRRLALASVLVALSTPALAETLICVEEAAGGLKFVDGSWKGVSFKVGGKQYIVAPDAKDSLAYQIKEIGQPRPDHHCTRSMIGSGLAEQMVCGGLGYGFVVNFSTLRFMEVYGIGYLSDDRTGKNTPSITGGKCTTINP